MSLSELYHVGIVVPDIEPGAQTTFRLCWVSNGDPTSRPTPKCAPRRAPTRWSPSNSATRPRPRISSSWKNGRGLLGYAMQYSNLHHIGFFSDSLAGDSRGLEASACPLEICGRAGEQAPRMFSYHRDPLGVRFEYVDAASRTMMEDFLFKAPSGSDGAP